MLNKNAFISCLVAMFAVSLSVSISATQVLAGIFLLILIWNIVKGKTRGWVCLPLLVPCSLFFVWSVLCSLVSNPAEIKTAISSPSALFFIFLSFLILDEKLLKHFVRWFCIGAVIVAGWGIFQKMSGVNFLPNEKIYHMPDSLNGWPGWLTSNLAVRNERSVGPRSHPLTYAEGFIPSFFVFVFFIFDHFFQFRKITRNNLIVGVGLVLIILALVFSEARGVILALLLGLPLMTWFLSRRAFLSSVLLIFFGSILVFSFSPKLRGRMLSVVSDQSGTMGDQQSKSIRLHLWKASLEEIRKNPLMGVGADGVALVAIDPVENKERIWGEAHNNFLQITLESGFVGLGLFIWILAIIWKEWIRIQSAWRAPILAIFISFLIAGLTESWVNDKEIAMIFWLFVGCVEVFRLKSSDFDQCARICS